MGVIYRPPASSVKSGLEELGYNLKNIMEKTRGDEHLVMGDFNIDFGHMEKSNCKKLRDVMEEVGLVHLRTENTRVTKYTESVIDLIFSDMKYVNDVGVLPLCISDHLPIYIVKKKQRNYIKREITEIRSMKRCNVNALENIIRSDIRWWNFWEENVSVDELWDIMYNIFIDAINILCPKFKKMSQIDRPNWVTKEVREAIREKNELYKKAKEKKTDEDWDNFRINKKLTARLISETKCSSMKNMLQENRGNPKKFWRQINRDILGKGNDDGIQVVRNNMGQCISGQDAADYVNKVYADMGRDVDDVSSKWSEESMNIDKIEHEFDFSFVELLEVHMLIKGIETNKSSGVDGINCKILKDCLMICEYELTYIINCSMYNMKFPREWKRSIITPIPKGGDKLNPENWRPINNLCVPGKILEKCVYRQVEEYMEKNKYVCKNQHGFRKGKGTDTAVMELVRELFANINDNKVSSILFLDYSRAFNTVNHQILLRKMKMYGFSEHVCNWFINYFKDRQQYTKVGTVLSSGVSIEHGVYQGSPLGPLLFIIYINDIVHVSSDVFCNMYADDTVIISTDICKETAMQNVGVAFNLFQDWCALNNIRVNKAKTRHMLCGTNRTMCETDREGCLDGIVSVDSFVYLGVTIDKNLNFEKFINATIRKVNGRLVTLARIRKLLDAKTCLLIQTILPILDYVSVLVNSSTQRRISKLQPLQNRAVRIVKKLTGYISTTEMKKLHKDLNLKWLDDRRKMFMLKIMFKLSKDETNVERYRPEMLLRTGPKVKMKSAFTNKERVLRSPFYLCNRLWDKLDCKAQMAKDVTEFNNILKKMDLTEL